MTESNKIKVGDIFYNSWGWEQTNINFYQVVRVTRSGKTVYVREVQGITTPNGPMTGTKVPNPGVFRNDAVISKRVDTDHNGNPTIKFKYGYGAPYDGEPKSCSWYA